jgi:GT2 family glycosyltransferase
MMKPHIAVLMACYNRREKTLEALRALLSSVTEATFTVYLVDDGSTDGTADAVTSEFPDTVVIRGDGNLFWAASMCLAERHAMKSHVDYLLWLNDDTMLLPAAIDRMLELGVISPDVIIVGATVDPDSGKETYGGRMRVDSHPQRFSIVAISDSVQEVQNFNGNCVLIPASVRQLLGPIDGSFPHAFADDDYGHRAMTSGVTILQAPSFVGYCSSNPSGPIPDGFIERWRHYESPKGRPWRAQLRYLHRHGNAAWPVYFFGGFAKRMGGFRGS